MPLLSSGSPIGWQNSERLKSTPLFGGAEPSRNGLIQTPGGYPSWCGMQMADQLPSPYFWLFSLSIVGVTSGLVIGGSQTALVFVHILLTFFLRTTPFRHLESYLTPHPTTLLNNLARPNLLPSYNPLDCILYTKDLLLTFRLAVLVESCCELMQQWQMK